MMNDNETHPRWRLAREAALFQLKLVIDGLRDAALIPVSFGAALLGLVTDRERPERYYRQVIDWGRQTERWIDLFGHHEPFDVGPVGSLDRLVDKLEKVATDEYERGNTTAAARTAVERALESLERRAREADTRKPEPGPGEAP